VLEDEAVVVTVAVTLAEFVPSRSTDPGEIEHVASFGAPLQAREMVPVNPYNGLTEIV